jgi:hypothetical protein
MKRSKLTAPRKKGMKRVSIIVAVIDREERLGYEVDQAKVDAEVKHWESKGYTCEVKPVPRGVNIIGVKDGSHTSITFCEMHKRSGGCPECPNRFVCDNSPLKIKGTKNPA